MSRAVELPLDLPELTVQSTGGVRVRRSVLPSGVRILSEDVPGSRSATIGMWVAVGSRDEQPGDLGSTHFLEHLLFKGTPSRTALDIAVSFDAVGGEHNAVTAKEYTCYYAKVQDRDLGMAVDVLADMVTSSLIDAEEFETERGVILEELAMADDDPGDVVSERFFEAVLGDHPLGRPIGGSPEDIEAAERDAVVAHYRRNYRPQDLVITAAGSVDHDALVARVTTGLERAGWDLSVAAAPVARRTGSTPVITRGSGLVVVDRPIEQTNILLGVPGLAASDDRRPALAMLNSVLGGGMSSRLFQEVREKRGLAYSVYSFGASYSDAGVFGLYAGCTAAKTEQVSRLMVEEFRKLAEENVTEEELARAFGQLSGQSALALEDSDTRMSRLGRSEITTGEYVDLDETLVRLSRVTAEDVRVLAADLISRPLSIAAVGTVGADAFAPLLETPALL
ncbi:M16 family metallopeptidase [Clavibacter michiganensis]|uniref:M16 family metallopeptidase n=1 Tax=Clavibacter michiganensis TaxID=28447 RepID=UPI001D09C10C|nr:pitrilysin family protein [Clavibacter michiganensis]MDO4044992.1 pitrilysin family protein [Clavibacter michiganensis]MDO4053942.1 pitrilysin family protein [Clavibacter michiganensis]MDO4056430.1 pitrilysin family protein [Clavibacter michiganensis]MDO4069051.1 pitrilysin family protein [Clavibacter michiganensis]UDM12868.1 insulinase family protein [Clavibacter michiganensis subsp. michiganensis]